MSGGWGAIVPESRGNVEHVARQLGVSPDTVYREIVAKASPAHAVGRRWRFGLADVAAWVRRGGGWDDAAPKGVELA